MERMQNLAAQATTAGAAWARQEMDASSASTVSADAITRNSEAGDQAVTAGGSKTSPHRASALGSDRLAKIFMRSKNMEMGPEVRRLVSDCEIAPFSKTLLAHTAIVPMLAEHMLTTAHGDMTQAFASAVTTGDECVAATFLEAGADVVNAAKGMIDRGQLDGVKFIIDHRLGTFRELELVAEQLVAHLVQKRDLAGLVEMSKSKNVQAGYLIATIAKMTDVSRLERVGAMRQVAKEDIVSFGTSTAEDWLARLLEEGDLYTVELMMDAGVTGQNVLYEAAKRGDRSIVEKLLRCNGAANYAFLSTPKFRDVASFIAYSLVKRDVLDEASSVSLKLHAVTWLLRQGEHFREGAEALLRDEFKAGHTHAVAILMSAGITFPDGIDLDEASEPVRTTDFQRQIDDNGNSDDAVKPRKQYV